MLARSLLLSVLALSLAACAGMKQRPDYAQFAGEPIKEFTYSQLYNWQHTNDNTMVLWTKPSTAYLLTLRNKCFAHEQRMTIEIGGVGNLGGKIRAGSDDVLVGQLRCRIERIQPIDLVRLKQG